MPRVTLTHTCNHPDCRGQAGDELDLSDELARYLLKRKGAVLTKPKPPKRQDKSSAEGDDEAKEHPGASETEAAGGETSSGGPQESARAARRRRRGGKPDAKDQPDDSTDAGDGDETRAEDSDSADAE